MRILEVISARSSGSLSESQIWLRNLYEPLLDLGHDVFLFPAEAGAEAKRRRDEALRAEFSQNMLDSFRREHSRKPFDLFFAYLMDGMVETGVLDEIRKMGVPTCNFSCNNVHQFDLVDEISSHFDYSLHSERDVALRFREVGANPVWFPMAANPNYYHPVDVPRTLDVSFVGQCYARRPYYIWHLLENGIQVDAYGPGWVLRQDRRLLRDAVRWARRSRLLLAALVAHSYEKRHVASSTVADLDLQNRLRAKHGDHLHEPISDDAMVRKYSESKISLGFLEVYDAHNPAALVKQHLHLREFEAPMSGALYLTGYCEELEEFYEIDQEVLVYRNEHELLQKVQYYLAHSNEADRIRKNGYLRACSCHTCHERFKLLFKQIGLEN